MGHIKRWVVDMHTHVHKDTPVTYMTCGQIHTVMKPGDGDVDTLLSCGPIITGIFYDAADEHRQFQIVQS